ncbi:ATP-binding protein [Streptomyces sp. NPDC127097]|uniref:ATP-binding protein n=1 Tax=Streptomyces sp. NPDC127097 TaxID=3347136 RepID=UPI00364DEBCD
MEATRAPALPPHDTRSPQPTFPAAPHTGDRHTSWPVHCDPAEVGRIRHQTTAQLHDWGLQDLSDTTELLVSELITNALRYAPGPIRLTIRILWTSLRCEIEDTNPTSPQRRTATPDTESGRGTELLDALTEAWASTRTPTGKTTWFTLPLPHPQESSPHLAD